MHDDKKNLGFLEVINVANEQTYTGAAPKSPIIIRMLELFWYPTGNKNGQTDPIKASRQLAVLENRFNPI
jgi:hypothetical protein